MTVYHKPVMLNESVEALSIKPGGTYVDLTFGGGGHSRAILEEIETGHLYAFDQDEEAESNAKGIEDRSFTFMRANFRHLKKYLKMQGVTEVDGILADLGISSHQIDEASRGFSTRFDGPLDMRMNQQSTVTAADLVAQLDEHELRLCMRNLGELKNAGAVARAICRARVNTPITTTAQLIEVVRPLAPRGRQNKFFAQVFQALRMKVNEELAVIEEMLEQGTEVLAKEGRFVVMSYHSLEDRLVKNFFNKGSFGGEVEKDLYGNMIRPLTPVNRKPVLASEKEIEENKRARSAKLRVAQKN